MLGLIHLNIIIRTCFLLRDSYLSYASTVKVGSKKKQKMTLLFNSCRFKQRNQKISQVSTEKTESTEFCYYQFLQDLPFFFHFSSELDDKIITEMRGYVKFLAKHLVETQNCDEQRNLPAICVPVFRPTTVQSKLKPRQYSTKHRFIRL